MDRETLVIRNRTMAEAYHVPPPKHFLRRVMLEALAHVPIAKQRPPNHERILLIRPDHIGDMLLATPAFYALRRVVPYAELHALVGPWSASVLETNPDIDAVITLDFPGFNRSGNASLHSPYELAYSASRKLRRIGYSHAIILRHDHWWGAMLAHLAGIPTRIGYNIGDTAPFLTNRLPFEREHAVMQNMRLISRWTGEVKAEQVVYRYIVNDADRDDIRVYLNVCGISPERSYFCIHPGSGTSVKQWTVENWATVADTLAAQLDALPVFTGGDHERALVDAITERMASPACVMAGDTDIGQLAALFEKARVVLGPDSGPLHLAAAVEAPTVALFGPADPVEFAQWGPKDRHAILTTDIGCRPCRVLDWGADDPAYHPCVREISVGRVLDAARRVSAIRS